MSRKIFTASLPVALISSIFSPYPTSKNATMLRRFEVKNFKCFKDNFVLDLTDVKNYEFNPECVRDGVINKALIYGPNACGKSNLGLAIFDIKNHLSDDKISEVYQDGYLYAGSDEQLAEFAYTFQFEGVEVLYRYGKKSADELVYEQVLIDGQEVLAIDRRKGNEATINLKGAETLKRDVGGNNKLSLLNYLEKNSQLEDSRQKGILARLCQGVTIMRLTHGNPREIYYQAFTNIFFAHNDTVKELEKFLNQQGIKCRLSVIDSAKNKKIVFDFDDKQLDFYTHASSGTKALLELYAWLFIMKLPEGDDAFFFIDEFDAFYHHELALSVMQQLKNSPVQVIATTHNTSIMTNDLLRPDCYFIMDEHQARPLHSFTDKELRRAHNIEKMYKAGAFN